MKNKAASFTNTLYISFFIILSAIIGIGIAVGLYMPVAAIVLVIPSIYILLNPNLSLLIISALTLVIAGSLRYFFGINQFQWVISSLGIALLTTSSINAIFSKKAPKIDYLTISIAIWWFIIIVSSILNGQQPLDWLVGIRIYLPFYGVFFYIAYQNKNFTLVKNLFLSIIIIGSLQWIFCLYQLLYIVPTRINGHYFGSPWDSIVGSFGGDKYGGGESGSLGIFLTISFAISLSFYKFNMISKIPFFVVITSCLTGVALTESKIVVLLIPIVCLIIYRSHIISNPVKFLIGSIGIITSMTLIMLAYNFLYWQDESTSNQDLTESLIEKLLYSFDPNFTASSTNLGRIGSLVFWWEKHSLNINPVTFLLGHGLASAVSSSTIIGEGSASHVAGTILDATGASKLLWESGLAGIIVFTSIYFYGAYTCSKIKNNNNISQIDKVFLHSAEASLILMPISIFYEVTIAGSPPMQLVAMLFLGYAKYAQNKYK